MSIVPKTIEIEVTATSSEEAIESSRAQALAALATEAVRVVSVSGRSVIGDHNAVWLVKFSELAPVSVSDRPPTPMGSIPDSIAEAIREFGK